MASDLLLNCVTVLLNIQFSSGVIQNLKSITDLLFLQFLFSNNCKNNINEKTGLSGKVT